MLMPQVVFIDREGMIQAQFSGEDPGFANCVQEDTLRNTLEKILKPLDRQGSDLPVACPQTIAATGW